QNEQMMATLMGLAQLVLIVILWFTWYCARQFHREQRNILYLRQAFKEKEKERTRSSRSRGNTKTGKESDAEADRNWCT
ncbi:hypothetical protein PFISCL1PPCAC_12443, partial [Pristionchus fissidentatus]